MFKRELIQELKARRYRLPAWVDYVSQHLRLAHRVMEERPGPVRSVIGTGLVLLVLVFAFSVAVSLLRPGDLGQRILGPSLVWLGLLSLWTLLHLGLLVDLNGRPVPRLGLPNALTLFRGVTIPVLVPLAVSGEIVLLFGVYLASAISDVADGGVARRLGPVTRLGMVMDPVVDIVWNAAAIFALERAGLLPGVCLALILTRYSLLVIGSAVLYLRNTTLRFRSTRFGKASGAVMSTAILLVLLNKIAMPASAAPAVQELLALGMEILLWGTIAHVIALGVLNFRKAEALEPVGRVVGHIRP
jgi:phosphatidylglycerophosphate synthase